MKIILDFFNSLNLTQSYTTLVSETITVILFLVFLYLISILFKFLSRRYINSKYFLLKNPKWQKAIVNTKFLGSFGYFASGFVAIFAVDLFFMREFNVLFSIAHKLVYAYFQISILVLINKILNIVIVLNRKNYDLPIKGIIQFVKIFISFFGGLIIFAYFIGREPTYFISALGVIASVLMIVFKDTIIGLTASWQLAMNKMLKMGDWISIPKHNADGEIIDISLTTVSIKNWDNTIISIPAYDFISGSFQNWRGMRESGSRRIKRAINIDIKTIKFIDQPLFDKLLKLPMIKDFLNINNKEQLTNIGIYRLYCEAYIKSKPYINTNFTTMVRQLPIEARGLPIEIYCFANTIDLITYESYQSEIFDHLLSTLKDFDLNVFQ